MCCFRQCEREGFSAMMAEVTGFVDRREGLM
jgi:hypothetical protein